MRIANPETEVVNLLRKALDVPPLLARVLASRGFTEPDEAYSFLHPRLDGLSDPLALPDARRAANRLCRAIASRETIGLFGDYDADGITSVALAMNFLCQAGVNPCVYLPRRDEGYGLNGRGIEKLREQGATLLVCLDCGSTNREEIDLAASLGMETIVLDHHELGDAPARPLALVNPKRPDATFPTRDLAACGVTFFFLLALRRIMWASQLLPTMINLKNELDLVTVGTVADMVPLVGDNRILVRFGTALMKTRPRQWLKSYVALNSISLAGLDHYTLGFIIIPRINAAGRVANPLRALEFLRCTGEAESRAGLEELNRANRQRQEVEEEILRDAIEQVGRDGLESSRGLVVYDDAWPVGVIGIVAQKLVETFAKPAIVVTRVNGTWKGSARAVDGLNLHQTITSLSPLLLTYGGHKYACGLSVLEENLPALREGFDRQVGLHLAAGDSDVEVDSEAEFDELTGGFLESLDLLAPFGNGNPAPLLLLKPSSITLAHRMIKLTDRKKRVWYGTAPKRIEQLPDGQCHVVASPTVRLDMGQKFVHLQVKQLIPAESE